MLILEESKASKSATGSRFCWIDSIFRVSTGMAGWPSSRKFIVVALRFGEARGFNSELILLRVMTELVSLNISIGGSREVKSGSVALSPGVSIGVELKKSSEIFLSL